MLAQNSNGEDVKKSLEIQKQISAEKSKEQRLIVAEIDLICLKPSSAQAGKQPEKHRKRNRSHGVEHKHRQRRRQERDSNDSQSSSCVIF